VSALSERQLSGRVGVGSASEYPHLKRRYINACNEWMKRIPGMDACMPEELKLCATSSRLEPVGLLSALQAAHTVANRVPFAHISDIQSKSLPGNYP